MKWISVKDNSEQPGNNPVFIRTEDGDISVGSLEINSDGITWRVGNDRLSWDYDFNLGVAVTEWCPIPKDLTES